MCGIAAIINGDISNIEKIMKPIEKRGEKENFNENFSFQNNILSCNRLKIVGRETGKQPVFNANKTIFSVLNGEIYNYKEIKRELEQEGYKFLTESDTEVLSHGYEEWGNKIIEKLNGAFAFIIYDSNTNEYFAGRDPFGIKPLFWAKNGETIYFASEIKQIIPFARDIQEILPGNYIQNKKPYKYYNLEKKNHTDDTKTTITKIRTLFDTAVQKRCDTDLPIGIFLSGGIDSTAVLVTAQKYHKNITAIVIGNDSRENTEESDYNIAKRFCTENNIKMVSESAPSEKELFSNIKEIVKITESFEPNMIKQSSLSLYLSKLAAKHNLKVVLCGEGADEIFCGYPEFLQTKKEEIQDLSFKFFKNLYKTQLQRVDRTSMSETVEVRVPFFDKEFVEYCINISPEFKIKESVTKWILREAMQDRLPEYVYSRKKIVLSEGMGLKGNSLENGLFTEKINNTFKENDLKTVQEKYPQYKISTKEEAFYFTLYKDFNYTNLAFTERTTVNKTHSKKENPLVSLFHSKQYMREPPSNIDNYLLNITKES